MQLYISCGGHVLCFLFTLDSTSIIATINSSLLPSQLCRRACGWTWDGCQLTCYFKIWYYLLESLEERLALLLGTWWGRGGWVLPPKGNHSQCSTNCSRDGVHPNL